MQTIALCKSSRQILIFSVFLSLGHCSALRPRTVPVNTHTLPPSSFLLRCQLCPLPCSEQMMDSPRTDSSVLLAFPHIRSPWDTHHRFRCSPCHLQRCHFLHSSLACSPTTWRLLYTKEDQPDTSLTVSPSLNALSLPQSSYMLCLAFPKCHFFS